MVKSVIQSEGHNVSKYTFPHEDKSTQGCSTFFVTFSSMFCKSICMASYSLSLDLGLDLNLDMTELDKKYVLLEIPLPKRMLIRAAIEIASP